MWYPDASSGHRPPVFLPRLLGLLLATATVFAQPATVPRAAHRPDGGMDAAMPGFARQVMARWGAWRGATGYLLVRNLQG